MAFWPATHRLHKQHKCHKRKVCFEAFKLDVIEDITELAVCELTEPSSFGDPMWMLHCVMSMQSGTSSAKGFVVDFLSCSWLQAATGPSFNKGKQCVKPFACVVTASVLDLHLQVT